MSEFKIESDVPVPALSRIRNARYPWRQMEIGQSFFVPGVTASKFNSRVVGARRATGFWFVTRTVDGGVRVWRVA